jgi:hypothetical protein
MLSFQFCFQLNKRTTDRDDLYQTCNIYASILDTIETSYYKIYLPGMQTEHFPTSPNTHLFRHLHSPGPKRILKLHAPNHPTVILVLHGPQIPPTI